MTIAVTGGTGFVGSALIRLAREAGAPVRALTRRPQASADGVEWVQGSLSDADSLARLADGARAVIHIAGVVNAPDAAGFEAGNVAGTGAILTAAKSAGVARFVHVSSLSAREPALSAYGASKRRGEEAVEASGLDWTIVRPPAVYGPGDTEMLDLFRMAQWGFVMMPPAGRLSLIHADDLSRLLLALAEPGAGPGMTFEADDARAGGWTYAEFARAIAGAMGRRAKPLALPRWMLELAARGDRLVRGKAAKLTPDRVSYMCHPNWVVDPALRPPEALWTPRIPTPEGLRETAEAYRAKSWL